MKNFRPALALCLCGAVGLLSACRAQPASPDELEAAEQAAQPPAAEGSSERPAARTADEALIDELKKEEAEEAAALQQTIEAAAIQAGAGTLRPVDPNTLGVRPAAAASANIRTVDSGNLRLQTNQLRLQRAGQPQLQHRLTLTPTPSGTGAPAPATPLTIGQ